MNKIFKMVFNVMHKYDIYVNVIFCQKCVIQLGVENVPSYQERVEKSTASVSKILLLWKCVENILTYAFVEQYVFSVEKSTGTRTLAYRIG